VQLPSSWQHLYLRIALAGATLHVRAVAARTDFKSATRAIGFEFQKDFSASRTASRAIIDEAEAFCGAIH
jgi:hypothetical protein